VTLGESKVASVAVAASGNTDLTFRPYTGLCLTDSGRIFERCSFSNVLCLVQCLCLKIVLLQKGLTERWRT